MTPMDKPNILIVKLSAIGDVVHTLPALNALRRHYPQAHIAWLVEEASAGLLKGHPALDRVLVSRRKAWLKGLRSPQWRRNGREIKTFIRCLRELNYDMVFDFQAALKGAALITLVRGRRKIGFGPGLQHQEFSYLMLNERIPAVSMEMHALERGLRMIEAVGIPVGPVEYRLPITADHRRVSDCILNAEGILREHAFVVVNPVAKWETKLWQVHKFAQTADSLRSEFNLPVVFTGAPEDRAYIQAIGDRMKTKSVNLAGLTDLITLAALLQRAEMMITTDTGPMHLAAAVGTPIVALFGPTAPGRTGPFGSGHQIVRTAPPCSPCYKRRCDAHHYRCMMEISVPAVLEATRCLLGASL